MTRRRHLAIACLLLAACYQQVVTAPNVAREPDLARVTAKRTSYLWGLLQSRDTIPVCTDHGGIAEVQVRANAGQVLLQILTLGIAVPRTVTFICAPREERPGDIGTLRRADTTATER